MSKVLLIGYGNPGRLDDGLGPALAENLEKLNLTDLTIDSDYQLTIEDAHQVSQYDIVIFADASVNCREPFTFQKITDRTNSAFSSHSVSAEEVLGVAENLFKSKAVGFALAIRGYDFNEFGEKLSGMASYNLQCALDFIIEAIKTGSFKEYIPD